MVTPEGLGPSDSLDGRPPTSHRLADVPSTFRLTGDELSLYEPLQFRFMTKTTIHQSPIFSMR